MSKFYLILVLLMIPLLTFGAVNGSKSFLHVQTASTLDAGVVNFRSDMRFYTKVADFLGQQKPANFQAYNLWVVQGNSMLSWGVINNFDLTVYVRAYQDLNFEKEYNSPDDVFLDLKVGSLKLKDQRFNFGGIFSFRFPSGDVHNYPFEPYTAGSLEYGLMGLFSYYNDPFIPGRDFSIHANLGWYNHNDAGKELYKTRNKVFKAGNNSSEFQYGFAFSYPTELFNLNLEFWGSAFTSQPDTMAFSRENFAYITPSITFKPRNWLKFDFGIDIRVSSDKDESSHLLSFQDRGLNLPNYPSWRVTLGTSIDLLRGSRASKGYSSEEPIEKKINFFENLLKEQERSKKIEEELRRLRKEREQAEKELEELKQLLKEKK